MSEFDFIGVIYNPNSTGNAKHIAEEFAAEVYENRERLGVEATLTPTEHAGHAIELATQFALQHARPLIVSVSGDGGFNEVINGAMHAKRERESVRPVAAVLGAGNANDHERVMRGGESLIDAVLREQPQPLDILKFESGDVTRYAHSYIGLGITSTVGKKLGAAEKGLLNEAGLVVETLQTHEPFSFTHGKKTALYDSVIFANINEMAKIVKLDKANTITDGKFELIAHRHYGKLRSVLALLGTVLFGAPTPKSYETYRFETTATSVQLDGEIEHLSGLDGAITVSCIKHGLESLYEA